MVRGPDRPVTETVVAKSRTVACDGGDGAYGHPKVYLRIDHDSVVCPYCSRLYVLQDGAGDGDAAH